LIEAIHYYGFSLSAFRHDVITCKTSKHLYDKPNADQVAQGLPQTKIVWTSLGREPEPTAPAVISSARKA
jgi:hypothetical protein